MGLSKGISRPSICWVTQTLAVGSLLLSSLSSAAGSAPRAELYAEHVRLDEPGSSVEATLRATFQIAKWLEAYAGYSHLRYELKPNEVERRSPLLGLRYMPTNFLRLFAEYRHSRDNLNSGKTADDPRLGVTAFYFTEFAPLSKAGGWFSDSYADIIHMSRYSKDLVLSGWSKLGVRARPLSNVFTDGYVEAFLQDTKDPALGRRAQELRYGVRVGLTSHSLTLSAQIFHRLTSWIPAPDARWRLIISLGGSF